MPEDVLCLGGFICLFVLWLIQLALRSHKQSKEKPMKAGKTKRARLTKALLTIGIAVGTATLSQVVVLLGRTHPNYLASLIEGRMHSIRAQPADQRDGCKGSATPVEARL